MLSFSYFNFLILIFFGLLLLGCREKKKEYTSNIYTLDSLLLKTEDFTIDHLKEIEEIKQKMRFAKTDSEKFYYNNQLFGKYFTLNADSAMHYAHEINVLAQKNDDIEQKTKSKLNKASILTSTGLLKGAEEVLRSINSSELNEDLLVEYYSQMINLYSNLGNYTGGADNRYYVTRRLYKDSIMSVIKPDHPSYLWHKGWNMLGTGQNTDSLVREIKERLASSSLNERQDAMNSYILARLFKEAGDKENYENYLALSAIIDVKMANAEVKSMEDLAILMFDDGGGDIDRAYSYINYCLLKALDYPNRSKAYGILRTLEKINSAYQKKLMSQKTNTIVFLILVCVLSLILAGGIIAFVIQNKKLMKQRKALDNSNKQLNQKIEELREADNRMNNINLQLKDLNHDLQNKNEELYESNFVKEEYIGYVFKLCSSYIAKIEEIKRNIYLKAMKKQWKEIEYATADLDMKGELKEFYHSFDTIFLNLYPTFVNDFNNLLKPDKQITVKEGELLNMELRIYALVRLGINDSVKIADFLHCAPQTVYNYRLRTRNRTDYSKSEFIEKVKSIGNFLGKSHDK